MENKDATIRLSLWVTKHNVPFLVLITGMICMQLWAGAFKLTAAILARKQLKNK